MLGLETAQEGRSDKTALTIPLYRELMRVSSCPFYRDSVRKSIICKGILPGSSITLNFCRKADHEIQLRVFCCEHYDKCEVYGILTRDQYRAKTVFR